MLVKTRILRNDDGALKVGRDLPKGPPTHGERDRLLFFPFALRASIKAVVFGLVWASRSTSGQ
ncbi:MAG: hypothetical protein MPW14_22080 [Candidatus Manganitrophus sp.]|nr:MAG: hypothetical protein MPW14_22080 [Candidatus Manganitrophus sp.]